MDKYSKLKSDMESTLIKSYPNEFYTYTEIDEVSDEYARQFEYDKDFDDEN